MSAVLGFPLSISALEAQNAPHLCVMFNMELFTKFRNRLPDLEDSLAVILFILLLPLILLFVGLYIILGIDSKQKKQFLLEYNEFLSEHDGTKIFCYTNRKNIVQYIEEKILPELPQSIKVVKLEGRTPITDLNSKYISRALYNLKQPGFPNIMYIKEGRVIDMSFKKGICNAINQGNLNIISTIINDGLKKIENKT